MSNSKFVHDLQAVTGFGDRMLDIWAVLTVAKLIDERSHTQVRWHAGPKRELNKKILGEVFDEALKRVYSTDHLKIADSEFVETLPDDIAPVLRSDRQNKVNDQAIVRLENDIQQIILVNGPFPGSSSPEILKKQIGRYGLSEKISEGQIADQYRAIAQSTTMSPEIAAAIPADADKRVGIHIRLTDKLVSREVPWEMTPAEWRCIERLGLSAVRKFISDGVPLLVCSDDPQYRKKLVNWIEERGGDVVMVTLPEHVEKAEGYAATADFFALSQSKCILQFTKYSTFSMAAALIGNIPIINLRSKNSKRKHLIKVWESAFREVRYAEDQLGTLISVRDMLISKAISLTGFRDHPIIS